MWNRKKYIYAGRFKKLRGGRNWSCRATETALTFREATEQLIGRKCLVQHLAGNTSTVGVCTTRSVGCINLAIVIDCNGIKRL